MTRDEIREIAEIVGGDKTYKRFIHRINKEFEASDENRNANVYVLIQKAGSKKVGFSVIGHSPTKMKVWETTFKEEGWVGEDFRMDKETFELMYMYVRPEFRGKGYADSLFRKTLAFSRQRKVKEIYAYVSDRVPTSLKFYKKMKAEVLSDFSDEDTTSAFLRWTLL